MMKIKRLKEVDSTNRYIKRYLAGGKDVIVTAKCQTGGLGTKGRSFLSGHGGVYLTALTFYDDLPESQAFRVMAHAAVAVCKTVEKFGVQPQIKWANDVFIGSRKITGILIENVISDGKIKASVIGIGVNVNNDVSALGGIATNLLDETGKKYSVRRVCNELIRNLKREYDFSVYLSYIRFLGQKVTVTERENQYTATALEILSDGRLRVKTDTGERVLSSAEISLNIGGV